MYKVILNNTWFQSFHCHDEMELVYRQSQVVMRHSINAWHDQVWPILMQSHINLHRSRDQPKTKKVGRARVHWSHVLGYHGSDGHGIWYLRWRLQITFGICTCWRERRIFRDAISRSLFVGFSTLCFSWTWYFLFFLKTKIPTSTEMRRRTKRFKSLICREASSWT